MPRDRPWRDPGTIVQLHDSASLILEFTRGCDRATFLADEKTHDAVILRLVVIGEATKRLSAAFTESHPQIEWSKMARMRDRLVHGYDQWNLDLVWDIVREEIPALREALAPLLPPDETDS